MEHEEEQGHDDCHDELFKGSTAHKRGEAHEKKLARHVNEVEEEEFTAEVE